MNKLKKFIEQYEQLDAEKAQIALHQKELMAGIKSEGFDIPVVRKLLAMRKLNPSDLAEQETILELYKQELGMN